MWNVYNADMLKGVNEPAKKRSQYLLLLNNRLIHEDFIELFGKARAKFRFNHAIQWDMSSWIKLSSGKIPIEWILNFQLCVVSTKCYHMEYLTNHNNKNRKK